MRIGFLFNHQAVHQVPHSAPYAFELSRRHPEFEVIIAASTQAEFDLAGTIGNLYPGHRCEMLRLNPEWWYSLVDPVLSKITFKHKKRVLENNLEFFRGLDTLVAPERKCRLLRTRYGLDDLKLIHVRHGAGDREVSSDRYVSLFDFVILPGQKYVDRLTTLGCLRPGQYAVTGWPEFEVVRGLNRERRRLFDNDNPVVVYNPHFDQKVASWKKMGRAVLDFFVANPQYNLVLAPHVILFARRWRQRVSLPRGYNDVRNVLIDIDSEALSDMTYLLAADIYLGDVSSQVYEFLLRPRPCIFLNAHRIDWRNNSHYDHWHLGEVVDNVSPDLGVALATASQTHERFLARQRAAFAYAFHDERESSAAQRGADAIAGFLAGGAAT